MVEVSRIFWDTNLFIYLIEERTEHTERVAELRRLMIERGDELLTSALTFGEVLVKPMEIKDKELMQIYEQMIRSNTTIVPFDLHAAPKFAEIRQDRSIKAPDAIQLACASAANSDLFITNDNRLSRKNIPGIQFIQSLENATL